MLLESILSENVGGSYELCTLVSRKKHYAHMLKSLILRMSESTISKNSISSCSSHICGHKYL